MFHKFKQVDKQCCSIGSEGLRHFLVMLELKIGLFEKKYSVERFLARSWGARPSVLKWGRTRVLASQFDTFLPFPLCVEIQD